MIEYVVSACLGGFKCRYDGKSKPVEALVRLYREGRILPLCPESLGGLVAPRAACEWVNGKAIDSEGKDRTANFVLGSDKALQLALASGCRKAILKSRSPSCGVGLIYDGSFSRTLRPGNGIWADKLLQAGFELCDENNLPDIL